MQDAMTILVDVDLPLTTFQVVQSSETVTDGYLWRRDVEPRLEQNQEGVFLLTIRQQGEFGKFDMPYIGSQIVHADEEMVVALVAYHGTEAYGRKSHKRVTKGQFYRFYQRTDDGVWSQAKWKQLNDETRRIVLAAHQEQAPSWAKVPGKLEEDYATPKKVHTKTLSYKLVQVIDGRYYSLYKPDEEYVLGKLKTQKARAGHRGGYFSYPDHEKVVRLFHERKLVPYRCYRERMQLALLECEISGRIIEYNNGKWASTYLRPLSVLSTFEYCPN